MRVRVHYKDIPETLSGQLRMLMSNYAFGYDRAVQYLMTSDFAKARGFSDALTEEQVIREMREVIRNGMG